MVRLKRRYFILQVKFPERPNYQMKSDKNLKNEILKAVEKLYGEYGLAVITNGFYIKYTNKETGVYYVRVDRDVQQLLRSSLPKVTKIESEVATVSCLKVAATMRHGDLFLKKYNEQLISQIKNEKINQRQLTKKEKILLKRKKRVQRR